MCRHPPNSHRPTPSLPHTTPFRSDANAHWLVVRNPGGADDGLFARDVEGNVLCWAVAPPPAKAGEGAQARADAIDISPAVVGEYTLADGRKAVPVFQL